jgi:hypothetical protein
LPILRKTVRRWLGLMLVCAITLGGAYATWPWWAMVGVRAALAHAGISVEQLELRRPTLHALAIERFTLTRRSDTYALRVEGRGVVLRYHWRDLWRGRLDELHADAIHAVVQPLRHTPVAPAEPLSIPLERPSALLARLPASVITLPVLTLDMQLAAGDQHFAGSAGYTDGTLQLQLSDTKQPQLSAHLHVDRRDQLDLTVQREQTLLVRVSNAIESPRAVQGALQLQLEPLSELLKEWGLLDRAVACSGTLDATWRGPLPAAITASSWRSATVNGELEARVTAAEAKLRGELAISASYQLAQGVVTLDLKHATATGALPIPAALAQRLSLPAAQPLQFTVRAADNTPLRIVLQPLQLNFTGAMQLTSDVSNNALHAAMTLTDPQLQYEHAWHLKTAYATLLVLQRINQIPYRAERAQFQFTGDMEGTAKAGALHIAGMQLTVQNTRWPNGAAGPVGIRAEQPWLLRWADDRVDLPAVQWNIAPLTFRTGQDAYRFSGAQVGLRDGVMDRHAIDASTAQLTLDINQLRGPSGPYAIQPVDVQTHLTLAHGTLRGDWTAHTPNDTLMFRGTLTHAFAQGRGAATAMLVPLTFQESGPYLLVLFPQWPHPFDLSGGRLEGSARVQWGPPQWSATLDVGLHDIAGFYATNLFKGLTTRVRADYANGVLQMPATAVRMAELDAGVALHELTFLAAVTSPDSVHVKDLQAQVLGGRVFQNAFTYHWRAADNTIPLSFEGIQLNQVLTLEQNIEGSGSLDGQVPVTLNDKGVSVLNGRFQARAPGGVIRYRGNLPQSTLAAVPALQLTLDSLKNFHYDTLAVEADYAPGGDLTLRTTLQGRNPDLAEPRPIRFNLNIRENVPDLLRSLQLSRDIGDKIEQRIQDFYQHQPREPAQ